MKWFRRIARIMARVLIFCVVLSGLNYIYVDVPPWERILWHNFYQSEGKIDNLYLGSSHVYYDIDPFLMDELNGQYNFNLSTSGSRCLVPSSAALACLAAATAVSRLASASLICFWHKDASPHFFIHAI